MSSGTPAPNPTKTANTQNVLDALNAPAVVQPPVGGATGPAATQQTVNAPAQQQATGIDQAAELARLRQELEALKTQKSQTPAGLDPQVARQIEAIRENLFQGVANAAGAAPATQPAANVATAGTPPATQQVDPFEFQRFQNQVSDDGRLLRQVAKRLGISEGDAESEQAPSNDQPGFDLRRFVTGHWKAIGLFIGGTVLVVVLGNIGYWILSGGGSDHTPIATQQPSPDSPNDLLLKALNRGSVKSPEQSTK